MGPTRTDDILDLVQQVHAGKTRLEILVQLQAKGAGGTTTSTQAGAEESINLTLRLVSLMKFGAAMGEFIPHRCPHRCLVWEQGSLKEHLAGYFGKPPVLNCDRVRLPKSFHAWGIERIGGINICFTDNLADHLLLVDDDSRLMIFHHASFLEYQHEAMRELADGGAPDRALHVLARPAGHSEAGLRRRDDATPRTIAQWWHDRRNGVQWYTFWVAILVLILTTLLGVVQCVESALQVYKAYVPS
ncbi:hypothetical protein PG994_001089 [Apiospora phragmitis]|uniref:Uncharacterized protein n=1 Tax=Apiospora phragmitis TaxID=2905665 RepID=A0ABR1WSK2_9PEZI